MGPAEEEKWHPEYEVAQNEEPVAVEAVANEGAEKITDHQPGKDKRCYPVSPDPGGNVVADNRRNPRIVAVIR